MNNGHQVENIPPLPSGINWTVLDDATILCRPGSVRRAIVVYNGPVTSLEAPENRDLAQRCQSFHHAGRLGLIFQSRRQFQTKAGQLVDILCSTLLVSSEEGAPSCTCHSHCRRVGSIPPHRAVLFFPSWMWPPSRTTLMDSECFGVRQQKEPQMSADEPQPKRVCLSYTAVTSLSNLLQLGRVATSQLRQSRSADVRNHTIHSIVEHASFGDVTSRYN